MARPTFLQRLGLGRRELRAWAMYDWANSAYATVITAAVLPPFFAVYYAKDMPPARATAVYAGVTSLSLLVSALLSPVLGTLADLKNARKKFLAFFTALGVLATALLFLVGEGRWLSAAALTLVSGIAFGAALVFYEGLLPHLAGERELDRVSAAGYALGYVGGGLLLALNTAWILWPGLFGMADRATATRWSLLSAAVWWGLFSIPIFRQVPEPRLPGPRDRAGGWAATRQAFARLASTFREVRQYRDLFVFLLAFWFYNDGIGTIIKMATIYGAELGIAVQHLVLALLITQVVAFPFSFLFGRLGDRIGPQRGIYVALVVYTCISVFGFLMDRAWHFYVLAILVGTVQGGAQALSRSLFARLVPRDRTGEFFGFFSVSSKFATILGPMVFVLVNPLTGSSRLSILSIVVFFLGGIWILSRVNVARGEAHARQVEKI